MPLSVLALIAARGGSKGLPGKNIKALCGKPLIVWSIEAALRANSINAVVVSTDDEAIAAVARSAGANVPFLRPANLAGDSASSVDVVLHALDWLAEQAQIFDIVVLLEPTSPLREAADIEAGLDLLQNSGADSVVSICRIQSAHPAFLYRQDEALRLLPYLDRQPTNLRRQDIEPLYFLDGTLYVSYVEALRTNRSFYHSGTVGYEVPKWKSLEIDDIDDFRMVEAMFAHRGLVK